MYKQTEIELLAPAKDKKCAFAAINAGADAIYIGATSFGARQKATNSLNELEEIINYAHLFNVKVYVTVNTIIYDNELKEVEQLIWDLYNIKTDAIIFQDFAILNMNLPPIELHASTQCHNNLLEKIQFLEECNVKRVVLPREFSITDIKHIKDNTKIELETFCHGALCVSYSGQCYLSYYIGKRSANRGECAQPCRKKYTLINESGKIYASNEHLLCLKDFNASNDIQKMIDAGATSFKIEGRLKDECYVKNVVLKYRKIIDEIIKNNQKFKKASSGEIITDFMPNLDKTFNRGYSNYFLTDKKPTPSQITSFDTPKFKGEYIGTVKKIQKNEIEINSKTILNLQDGITYFYNDELCGTKIVSKNNFKYKLLNSKGMQVGTKIYRNHDEKFLKELTNSKIERKLNLNILININTELLITAKYNDIQIEHKFKNEYENANNQEQAYSNIKKQFSKLGNTVFQLNNLEIKAKILPHIKLSDLNSMRHSLISELTDKILSSYKINLRNTNYKIPQYPFQIANSSFNISNKQSQTFYGQANVQVQEFAPEMTNKYDKLMVCKHCLKREFGMCSKDVGTLYLVDEFNTKYPLNFDCTNCQMEVLAPLKD